MHLDSDYLYIFNSMSPYIFGSDQIIEFTSLLLTISAFFSFDYTKSKFGNKLDKKINEIEEKHFDICQDAQANLDNFAKNTDAKQIEDLIKNEINIVLKDCEILQKDILAIKNKFETSEKPWSYMSMIVAFLCVLIFYFSKAPFIIYSRNLFILLFIPSILVFLIPAYKCIHFSKWGSKKILKKLDDIKNANSSTKGLCKEFDDLKASNLKDLEALKKTNRTQRKCK